MLGVQGDVTYISTTDQLCVSIGLALSLTGAGGMSVGAYNDPKNAAPNVVPGWSWGGNLQTSTPVGYSTTSSRKQPYLTGLTIGDKGVTLNASYGWCADIHEVLRSGP